MRIFRFLSLFFTVLAAVCAPAHAEEFPGGDSSAEFEKGFGASGGISEADKGDADEDRLKIGGAFWAQAQYLGLRGFGDRDGYLQNANTMWLYFDSRLRDDVRAYIKLRGDYSPTLGINPYTLEEIEETSVGLEEAKLMFNVGKSVFFTIGKQKLKWGSGKFWNPTDVMNNERRNLMYNEDVRLGLNMIKTHVPVGSANFYLVNRIEGSNDPGLIQHALRAEVPVGTAELAATASFLKGEKPVFGVDLSTALWELDFHAEAAHTQGSSRTYYDGGAHSDPSRQLTNFMTGLSYDYKYSDQDALTVSVEYFRNGAGVTSIGDYEGVLTAAAYQPYHLSRDYGMFMIYVPTPGRWEHVSFTMFNILNLTDQSAATKLMATLSHWSDMDIDLGMTAHYGNSSGELQVGGQFIDADVRLRVEF
jgi:hypothetical protein